MNLTDDLDDVVGIPTQKQQQKNEDTKNEFKFNSSEQSSTRKTFGMGRDAARSIYESMIKSYQKNAFKKMYQDKTIDEVEDEYQDYIQRKKEDKTSVRYTEILEWNKFESFKDKVANFITEEKLDQLSEAFDALIKMALKDKDSNPIVRIAFIIGMNYAVLYGDSLSDGVQKYINMAKSYFKDFMDKRKKDVAKPDKKKRREEDIEDAKYEDLTPRKTKKDEFSQQAPESEEPTITESHPTDTANTSGIGDEDGLGNGDKSNS